MYLIQLFEIKIVTKILFVLLFRICSVSRETFGFFFAFHGLTVKDTQFL